MNFSEEQGGSPLYIKSIAMAVLAVIGYYYAIFGKRSKAAFIFLISILILTFRLFKEADLESIGTVVDFNTIGLLLGMMIIVGILKTTGFFQYVAIKAVSISGANFWKMIFLLMFTVALVSAFLDNLITIILVSPMIFLIADSLEISPVPFIMMTIFADNFGGSMTLIGSPLNIVLGSISKLSFGSFLINMTPIALLSMFSMILLFKKSFPATQQLNRRLQKLSKINPADAITDLRLMKISLGVFLGVLLGLILHSVFHVEMSLMALLGAMILLLILGKEIEDVAKNIDWDTIFLFMGLFVISYGLKEIGVISALANLFSPLRGFQFLVVIFILWLSAVATPFLSAVPATLIFAPALSMLVSSGFTPELWWAFAIGANFGSNLTPVGAVQNLAGVAILEKNLKRHFPFGEYFRYSFKVTFLSMILATVYITVRWFVF